jgi:uncharacterized protein YdeI (YjbR/CyaY-like superfamily)
MDIGKTLCVHNRTEWREWLADNFMTEDEIWLIYPSKATGELRIPYNDAVEEALSFGWIDSTVKRIDDYASAQRFSPRKTDSEYSQSNKERLKWLIREEKVHPSIKESVEKVIKKEFVFPSDIMQAIQQNEKAWTNYHKFSPAYQRIRVAYIDAARNRPDEFKKRLKYFIKTAEQNRMIGFGGIDKYY